MSNKQIKNISSSRKNASSKKQPNISKYFISDANYPTSFLRKRQAAKESDQPETENKILKLYEQPSAPDTCTPCGASCLTCSKLHTFSFSNTAKGGAIQTSPVIAPASNRSLLDSTKNSSEEVCKESEALEDRKLYEADETILLPESRIRYTPLEKQYLEFKKEYPDAILLIECGYKYKMFDKDAKLVSKLFNLAYFRSHNFMQARVLTSRLYFYVQQLVLRGYKVGVVKQSETAAIKAAGTTKNELFARKLDAMYTKSTLIGEEFSSTRLEGSNDPLPLCSQDMSSGYLMCLYEEPSVGSQSFNIAFVAIQASSGDMTYASFQDSPLRNALETHLVHVNPGEILLPLEISKETENLVSSFSTERMVRTEKIEPGIFDPDFALSRVSSFYAETASSCDLSPDLKQTLLSLPPPVITCLSALIPYLSKFKLEGFLKHLNCITPLSTENHMILNSTTLKGLDVLNLSSCRTERGSLFWVLNKNSTKFGERLLKSWISKPLKNLSYLEERLNIVSEVIHSDSMVFKLVEKLLFKLPDLEKILCNVFYQKCNCPDFLKLLEAFAMIRKNLLGAMEKIEIEVESPRLKIMFSELPELLADADKQIGNIDPIAARRPKQCISGCIEVPRPEILSGRNSSRRKKVK